MGKPEEAKRGIFAHHSETYLYNDRLKWSRFQTAIAIEAAVLAVVYNMTGNVNLNPYVQVHLMVFGFAFVLLLCLLSQKDEADQKLHLEYISSFEKENDSAFVNPSTREIKGSTLIFVAIILLNLANAMIFAERIYALCIHH